MNPPATSVEDSRPSDRLEEPERLPDEIDDDTLRKYFTLTKSDLEQVAQCRGPTNRLGFAVQLCTLRWQGYFLPDTRDVPGSIVEMIGSQLGLLPISLESYPQNEKTRFEHLERIRQHLKFVRCDAPQRDRLLHHLTEISQRLTRATALRQAAHEWLKQERIVRPGRTTQQVFVPLSWFVVNGSDELVLHFNNAVRHFGACGVQEADHNGFSLGCGKPPQVPDAVSIRPIG